MKIYVLRTFGFREKFQKIFSEIPNSLRSCFILFSIFVTLVSPSFAQTLVKSVSTGGPFGSSGSVDVGTVFTYRLQYTFPSTTGGFSNVVITDALPAGVEFFSKADSIHIESSTYDFATNTVTFEFVNPLPSGATGEVFISALFPDGTLTNATATNNATIEGSGPGLPVPSTPGGGVTVTALNGDSPGEISDGVQIRKTGVANEAYLGSGFSYGIRHGSLGGTNVTGYVIEDNFPPEFIFESWRHDRSFDGNTPLTFTVDYKTNTNSTSYTAWPPLGNGNSFDTDGTGGTQRVNRLNLAAGEYVTALRYTFNGTIPSGPDYIFSTEARITVVGDLTTLNTSGSPLDVNGATVSIGTSFANTVTLDSVEYAQASSTATTNLVADQAVFSLRKSIRRTAPLNGTGPVPQGAFVRVELDVLSPLVNVENLVNPKVWDLLPPEMEFVGPVTMSAIGQNTSTPTLPDFTITPNFNGTGRTLLAFEWDAGNPFTIMPSTAQEGARISFLAQVPFTTTTGNYFNEILGTIENPHICQFPNRQAADENDFDGDGDTTEIFCGARRATLQVAVDPTAAGLDSQKWVKGECDTVFSRFPDFGSTVPGGAADYELRILNPSSVGVRDITVIDILPFVGDTGVVDTSPRLSEWRPVLAGPVDAPSSLPTGVSGITVFYSTSSNPDRSEIGLTVPGADDAAATAWSMTPPSDITTVQSLRFEIAGTLGADDSLIFGWPMRAPLDAPTNGEIAWNSFGFSATNDSNNSDLLATEPVKVGFTTKPQGPALYGNYVWFDTNRNGIQESSESGINGVRVELYSPAGGTPDPDNDTLVKFTVTQNDGTNDGGYVFSELTAGDYYAVFYPPTGFTASPADQGTDDTEDSDGTAGLVGTTAVQISAITALGASEIDTSWDQGFYDPSVGITIGDFVWVDTIQNDVQDPSELGIPGVEVKLIEISSGNQIGSTTTDSGGLYLFGGPNNENLTVTNQVTAGTPQIVQISASRDDAIQQNPTANVSVNGSDLDLGQADNGANPIVDATVGLRFTGIDIPAGATVTSASIQFSTNDAGGSATQNPRRLNGGNPIPVVNLMIAGEAVDDADQFTGGAGGASTGPAARPKTTANVGWTPEEWAGDNVSGIDQETPDLSAIVQEVINRPGWASGNDIAFLIDGSGQREAESFDGSASNAPTLEIQWEMTESTQNTITDAASYQVCIDTTQVALTGYTLIPAGANISNSSTTDTLDSDAMQSGGDAVIAYTASSSDSFNLSLDFGFDGPPIEVCELDIASVSGSNYDAASNSFDLTVDVNYLGAPDTGGGNSEVTFVVGSQTFTRTLTAGVGADGSESFTITGVTIGTSVEAYFTGSQGDAEKSDTGTLLTPQVGIGNFVWHDTNNSGTFDAGENPIADDLEPGTSITIELYLDADADGVIEPNGDDGGPLDTQTISQGDPDSNYDFTGLIPGRYYVSIPNPTALIPLSSTVNGGLDDGVNNDDNGLQPDGPGTRITSSIINLQPNQEIAENGSLGNIDQTIDFGLVDPAVGNLVWWDRNNNGLVEDDEPGLPDVIVEIYNTDTNLLAGTTMTDGQGLYIFADLTPGNYEVRIPAVNFTPVTGALEHFPNSSDTTVNADNQIDEDDNGIQLSRGAQTVSPIINLMIDAEPVDGMGTNDESGRGADLDNTDDNNGDMTVDFGFYGCSIDFTSIATTTPVIDGSGNITYDLIVSLSYLGAPTTGSIQVEAAGLTETTVIDPSGISTVTITGITVDEDGPFEVTAIFTDSPVCSTLRRYTPTEAPACTTGQIGGVVYRDGDADGVNDTGEAGRPFIAVRAYDCDNALIGYGVSDKDGEFTIVGLDGVTVLDASSQPLGVRLEFDVDDDGSFKSSVSGGTLTQFVTSSGNCNIEAGVINPADTCQLDPFIIMPCYVNGDPLLGGDAGTADWLVRVPYTPAADRGENVYLADGTVIGAVWGTAYQSSTDRLFSAAVTKRHAGYGIGGPGAIYVTNNVSATDADPSPADYTTTLLVDLNTVPGINVGTIMRDLPADKNDNSRDAEAFDAVGKIGLGDLDISEDGKTLYTVNLNTDALIVIPIDNPTAAVEVPIDSSILNIIGGEFRPWAVGVRDGEVFVGGVASGEHPGAVAEDLVAFVLKYTPGALSDFIEVLEFPLNYQRDVLSSGGGVSISSDWRPWIDQWTNITDPAPGAGPFGQTGYPQPMFTDLEFDSDGTIIIGLMDRFGMQGGNEQWSPITGDFQIYESVAGGDILKMYLTDDGGYGLETNAGPPAGAIGANLGTSAGMDNTQGPDNGEFFYDDRFFVSSDVHTETSLGGLAVLPGSNSIVVSVYDPVNGSFDQVRTGGLRWYSTGTGETLDSYEVFERDAGGNGSTQDSAATFGKAAGIGDPSLSCEQATIEIGNYVFIDNNEDGVQDSCDTPLAGVNVTLYDSAGVQVATAMSDINGYYRFSSSAGINNGSEIFNLTGLQPNAAGGGDKTFYVVVGDQGGTPQFDGTELTVGSDSYTLTLANVTNTGTGSNAEQVDNDGVVGSPAGALSNVLFTTVTIVEESFGSNNHSFDFGFIGEGICELNVSSVSVSNIGVTTADYSIDLSFIGAPVNEVTIVIGGETFTRALSGAIGSQTVTVTGAPLNGTVEIFFTGSQGVDDKSAIVNLPTPTTPISCGVGDIGGTLFQDFDADGERDALEPTIAFGLSFINAYDENNTIVGSSIVGSNGVYAISGLDLSKPYRLELVTPSGSALGMGAAGVNSGSNVQFINGETCDADFSIQDPSELCLTTGTVITPSYVNGDPLLSGTAASIEAFVGWPETNRGQGTAPNRSLPASDVGAVWGVATDSKTQTVYTSAVLKRHAGFGPDGPGAIYKIDATGAFAASSWVTLSNAGTDPRAAGGAANTLTGSATGQTQDQDAFGLIGKIGIGDIDLSADCSTLYAVNLNTKSLVLIDAASGMEGASLPIPAPAGVAATNARPWAIEVYRDEVYVGTVDAVNLTAHVLKLEGSTFVEVAGPFDLTYPRTNAFNAAAGDIDWLAWSDTYQTNSTNAFDGANENSVYPQPILADIEFDSADGSLILGLMDRRGMQTGALNFAPDGTTVVQTIVAGDILRACPDGSGGFTLENAGLCNTAGSGTTAGDGPGSGEFYDQDFFSNHKETIFGGLAHRPGTGEVVASVYDPFSFRSGGVSFFDNSTGGSGGRYEVYEFAQVGTFGNAVGLGDVEFLCDEAPPLIVGNRLWFDVNGNGVQDPNEPGLPNINITLDDGNGGTVVTQTLSDDPGTPADEAGTYYFSSNGNADGVLTPDSSFTISVDLSDPDLGAGVTVTTGTDATNDEHDNDANAAGEIIITSPSVGMNDFSYDIGLVLPRDFGDAPDSYLTTSGAGGAAHAIVPGIMIGNTVDDEMTGVSSTDALGDGVDEDGVTFPDGTSIPTSGSYCANVVVTAPSGTTPSEDDFFSNSLSGGAGWTTDWIEGGDDDIAATGQVTIAGGQLGIRNSGRSISRSFTVVAGADSYNLKFNAQYLAGVNGSSGDLDIEINGLSVGTVAQSGGTLQNIDIDITSVVSAGGTFILKFDTDAISAAENDNGFDIDNLSVMTTTAGSSDAILVGWVDLDGSGTFDADEAQVISGASLNTDGVTPNKLTFPIVAAELGFGSTYARFRLSTDPALTASTPGGTVNDGEVEDYALTIQKRDTYSGFLVGNAEALGLDDNVVTVGGASASGSPAIDPFDSGATTGITDTDNDDMAALVGVGSDPDGDGFSNLLEYALCYDPDSGLKTFPDGSTDNDGFNIAPAVTPDQLDISYTGPTGAADLAYTLQQSTDGQVWTDVSGITPTTAPGAIDGTTKTTFGNVTSLSADGPLLFRLKVDALDVNNGNAIVASDAPQVIGYNDHCIRPICETFSDPFLMPCEFTGTVTSVSGQDLVLTGSLAAGSDMSAALTGSNYYVEVVSGANAGQRFDITSVGTDRVTLANDSDLCALTAPHSTITGAAPANLMGDQIVIRQHRTVADVYPVTAYEAGGTLMDSARILLFNSGTQSYVTYQLDSTPSIRWEDTSGNSVMDNIVPPGQGAFTHNVGGPDLGAMDESCVLQYGEVRETAVNVPLCDNYNFISSLYPIAQTANGMESDGMGGMQPTSDSRQMNQDNTDATYNGSSARSRADQVQLWNDDTNTDGVPTVWYKAYFYAVAGSIDQWVLNEDSTIADQNAGIVFDPDRSAIICVSDGSDRAINIIPTPIDASIAP